MRKKIIIKKDGTGMSEEDFDIQFFGDGDFDFDENVILRMGKDGDFLKEGAPFNFKKSDGEDGVYSWLMTKNKVRLGIVMSPNAQEGLAKGVAIDKVQEESAAAEAGLQEGDVILSIDGKEMTSIELLQETIQSAEVGAEVKIDYERAGSNYTTTAKLGTAKGSDCQQFKYWEDAVEGMSSEEANKAALGIYINKSFEAGGHNGVLISRTTATSGAAKAGLQEGDIITKVDGETITNVESLNSKIATYQAGDVVTVTYLQKGETKTVQVTLGKKGQTFPTRGFDSFKGFDSLDPQMKQFFKGRDFDIKDSKSIEEWQKELEEKMENSIEKGAWMDIKTDEAAVLGKTTKAVNSLDLLDSFSFYPNPSNGQFQLSFSTSDAADTNIRLLDLSGKEIMKQELNNFSGDYNKAIDVSDAGKGVFLLQIEREGKVMNQKVVVQ